MFIALISSIFASFGPIIFDKAGFEKKAADAQQRVEKQFTQLEKEYAIGPFLCGKEVRVPDFLMYELFEVAMLLHPGIKAMCPNIVKMREEFENLKGVKEYRASSKYNSKFFPPHLAAVNT